MLILNALKGEADNEVHNSQVIFGPPKLFSIGIWVGMCCTDERLHHEETYSRLRLRHEEEHICTLTCT